MDDLAGDQARFDALAENVLKECPEQVHSPATASLTENAVIGQFAVEIVLAEPKPVQPFGQPAHELAFGRNVLKKEDEHELEQDDRVDRRVTTLAVAIGYHCPNEGKIHHLKNLAERVVRAPFEPPVGRCGSVNGSAA